MKNVILALLAMTLLVGATPKPAKQIEELARVNGEIVGETMLRQQFVKRHGGHEKFLGGEADLRKFLELVVDQRLLIQEAYNLGLDQDAKVKPRVDEKRDALIVGHLVKMEINDKGVPTPEEIRSAWQEKTTSVFTARQIVLDTRREANEVRAALQSGADFETLARACSTGQSRLYGGQLPPLVWGSMSPHWEEVVEALEEGEISPVFHTESGWEIVQLQKLDSVSPPDFAAAAPKIKGILEGRKLEARRKAFSEELFAKYQVVIADVSLTPSSLLTLSTTAPETLLASWNGGSLKVSEFDPEPNLRMLAFQPPGRAQEEIERQLRLTIHHPLTLLEARSRKIADIPSVAAELRTFQEELMEGALYDHHVLKQLAVTEEDVKRHYEENTARFVSPEKRRVAQIVVATEEAAKDLRQQLLNGESFAVLAKKHSLDTASGREGGDLGPVTPREVPKEFAAILTLQEGDIAEPVKTEFGWHLIKVSTITPEHQLSFDEAKEDVRKTLAQKRQREARAYWVKKLREAADIRINEKGIREFVKQNPFEETKEGK